MGQSLGHLQVNLLKNHNASHGPDRQPFSNLKIELDGLMTVLRLVCHGLDSPAHLVILQTTDLTKQLEYLIIRYDIAHFLFEIWQLLKR